MVYLQALGIYAGAALFTLIAGYSICYAIRFIIRIIIKINKR